MKFVELYRSLCRIYDIRNPQEIERFIVTSQPSNSEITIGNRMPEREALLIRESGDSMEIGLYFSPDVLRLVESEDPLSDIDLLACAIEGVSHFVYLCDRIEENRQLTQLELELQAEVDKFLLLHLIALSNGGIYAPDLFNMQFQDHSFDSNLDPAEIRRYKDASRLAAKYCHHLLKSYFNPLRFNELIAQVREFFHKNLSEKVSKLTP